MEGFLEKKKYRNIRLCHAHVKWNFGGPRRVAGRDGAPELEPPLAIRVLPRKHYGLHYTAMLALWFPILLLLHQVFLAGTMSIADPKKGGMHNIVLLGFAAILLLPGVMTVGRHIATLFEKTWLFLTGSEILYVSVHGNPFASEGRLQSFRREEIGAFEFVRGTDSPAVFDMLHWRGVFPYLDWLLLVKTREHLRRVAACETNDNGDSVSYPVDMRLGDVSDEAIELLRTLLADAFPEDVAITIRHEDDADRGNQ